MANIIKLTEEEYESAKRGFIEFLSKRRDEIDKELSNYSENFDKLIKDKSDNGEFRLSHNIKIDYKKDLSKVEREAEIKITPEAWIKMQALIAKNDKEVAWHGVAEKTETGKYIIKDILVYPQQVTATTVDRDREKYEMWLNGLDDDTFNNLRMQGHSHVNMGVSPSGTDIDHQKEILDQLFNTDYYIFMIMNKSMNIYARVFDLADNIVYEKDDITVSIDGVALASFIKDASDNVEYKTYTHNNKNSKANNSSIEKKSDETSKQSKCNYRDDYYGGYYGGGYYGNNFFEDDDYFDSYAGWYRGGKFYHD